MNIDDFRQYACEEAKPKPKATINSYRSFGYNLQTAIADIIDNSISAAAKNIWIEYCWAGSDSYLTICDDGNGMDLPDLVDALTPGSKDPEHLRVESDLGRFGLGLKTASFSQCKRLTVLSKTATTEMVKRCWDLDYVNEVERWELLNYLSDDRLAEPLNVIAKGTLVIWEKLDRLVGTADKDNEYVRKLFFEEFNLLEKHLSMVFHKYIENKKLILWINGSKIVFWNPFLLNMGSSLAGAEVLGNGNIEVKAFILPHTSKLTEEQRIAGQGIHGWYEQQGFYIYRNQRLLIAGDWLGMFAKNEHSKLARLSIEFPNSEDSQWALDIKKSTAKPPSFLRRDLYRLANFARKESAKVYNFRGSVIKRNPELPEFDFQPVWKAEKSREGRVNYIINKDNALLKNILSQELIDRKKVRQLINIIQKNIPVESIIYFQNEDPGSHELRDTDNEMDDSVVVLAQEIFSALLIQGLSKDMAFKQLFHIEPFNRYPGLIEYLKDE
jgi:hypothetical protein